MVGALGAGDAIVDRVLAFGRRLREAGIAATPARVHDALRSLEIAGIADGRDVRSALRVNLVSSREEGAAFDRLFERFWDDEEPRSPGRLELESLPASPGSGDGIPAGVSDGTESSTPAFGRGEVDRVPDLRAAWPGGTDVLERTVDALARRLATRRSRRLGPARRGRFVDLRRSLRRSVSRGLGGLDLARAARRIRKTRIVLLCDVSGSMEAATAFLLPLMVALQKRVAGSRTILFSTRSTEVTRALRRGSVGASLARVARLASHWSGGTDVGGALATVNRDVLRDGRARSTVCVIVSDGFDQKNPDRVGREMRILRRRCRSVVWVNPLVGTPGYEPRARGMRAARPFVDHFLGCGDAASLRRVCRVLTERGRRRR